MIPLIQRELDEFCLTVWNTHGIRAQKELLWQMVFRNIFLHSQKDMEWRRKIFLSPVLLLSQMCAVDQATFQNHYSLS